MSDFKIERFSGEHIAPAAALERECFSLPWSEQSLSLLCGNSYPSFAATCDGELVGYIGCSAVLDEVQILNLAVASSKRRRGVASAMLASLDEYAAREGVALISLEVRESNLSARALYEKHGYVAVGRRAGFYSAPREDAVIMIKQFKLS